MFCPSAAQPPNRYKIIIFDAYLKKQSLHIQRVQAGKNETGTKAPAHKICGQQTSINIPLAASGSLKILPKTLDTAIEFSATRYTTTKNCPKLIGKSIKKKVIMHYGKKKRRKQCKNEIFYIN